jgi:hypothetical protein
LAKVGFSRRPKRRFHKQIQSFGISFHSTQKFLFHFTEILLFISDPARQEGRFAVVTISLARDAMDAARRQTCDELRTAKSCGPDPPTLGSSLRERSRRRWRLASPVLRGDHEATVNTIAQGMPMFGLFLW